MKISNLIVKNITIASVIALGGFASQTVLAAATPKSPSSGGAASSGSSGSSSSGGSRSFLLVVPVVPLTREAAFRAEVNLSSASISVESAMMGAAEEYPLEKLLLTGDSMISDGRQIALMLSRYGNQGNMSGWFWTLGAGMRTTNGTWKTSPSPLGLKMGLSLVNDENGKIMHRYTATGATGHARWGYRWVSQSIPLTIGGHLGVRHFDGKFNDVQPMDADYSPLAIDEKALLRRRYMTHLEPAIEFGLAF